MSAATPPTTHGTAFRTRLTGSGGASGTGARRCCGTAPRGEGEPQPGGGGATHPG